MKRDKKLLALLLLFIFWLAVAVVYATDFSSDTYDTATPAGSDDPAEADDRMRETKSSIRVRENVDHYWPLTGTEVSDADTGEHRKVLFHAPIASTPTVAENHGDLRVKDVNSKAELHWTDEDENELQLTSMGNNLARGRWLTSSNVAGSVNLIRADANDVAVLPDNSQTATNAAPTSSTGIANKKYVDDQVSAKEAVKAWVTFNGKSANPITKDDGFNISGTITKNGTGDYTITWDTDFADTNYCVQITAGDTTGIIPQGVYIFAKATGTCRIKTVNVANSATDYEFVNVVVFGTQ